MDLAKEIQILKEEILSLKGRMEKLEKKDSLTDNFKQCLAELLDSIDVESEETDDEIEEVNDVETT